MRADIFCFSSILVISVILTIGCGRSTRIGPSSVSDELPPRVVNRVVEAGSYVSPRPAASRTGEAGSVESGSVERRIRRLNPDEKYFDPYENEWRPLIDPEEKTKTNLTDQRFLDLNRILANREMHRGLRESKPWTHGPNPKIPEVLLHNVKSDQLGKLLRSELRKHSGQKVRVRIDNALGLVDQEFVDVLKEAAQHSEDRATIAELSLSSSHFDDEVWTAISNLETLNSIELSYTSINDEQFERICGNENIQRVTIESPRNTLSSASIQKVLHLPQLKHLQLGSLNSLVNVEGINRLWKPLGQKRGFESLVVVLDSQQLDGFRDFLEGPVKKSLKKLIVHSQPVQFPTWVGHYPRLEELTISLKRSKYPTLVEPLLKMEHAFPRLKKLKLSVLGGYPYDERQIGEVLTDVSRLEDLESLELQMEAKGEINLEPLTRVAGLKHLAGLKFDLNRTTLHQLTRMPRLETIHVNGLEFGSESAHLLPWLTNLEYIYIEKAETLNTSRFEMLATIPQLSRLEYWTAPQMQNFYEALRKHPQIKITEYD